MSNDWPGPTTTMNSSDEYSYRETSLPIDPYEFRETSSPHDEYAYRETSPPSDRYAYRRSRLPTKESMFLPLLGDSPEDSSDGADRAQRAPTLSPVLLSPGSTTQKLIAAGKIKNCIILLQKTSLDHSSFRHLTDEATETTTLPHETEPSKDLPADSAEESGAEVTSSPNCEQDNEFDSEALDCAKDRCASNRNIFTSFLSEWSDVKIGDSTTVEDRSDAESTSSTIIDDYTEDTNGISSSKEICPSVSSSNTIDPITDSQSINGDDEVDQMMDSRSVNGDNTSYQITDYQSEIGANTICQIVDCRSISTDNIVDQTTDCCSVKSDTEINYVVNYGTIDQNTDCRSVNDDIATNHIPECHTELSTTTYNDNNCRSRDTDPAEDRTDSTVSTVDQITDCQSFTNTDVIDESPVPDIFKRRSSWNDDLMSISSTGSSETIRYPLSPGENSQERFEISEDDQCCVEPEIPKDAEIADRVCDEPPCLERLESLPTPGTCLDLPPLLSPPMLTNVNDDIHSEMGNRSASLYFRASRMASPKGPPSGHTRQELKLSMETAEPPVICPVGMTEITSHLNQKQLEPIKPDEHMSPVSIEVFSSNSTECSKTHSERTESCSDLKDPNPSKNIHNELRGISFDAYVSFPSPPTETATDGQGSFQETFPNLMDSRQAQKDKSEEETPVSQEDQYQEVEYQEMCFHGVNRSDACVNKDGIDIPRHGSAADLQITEVVSLGECTPAMGHELPNNLGEKTDFTPDMMPCTGVVGQKTDSTASSVDQGSSVHECSIWADDSLDSESEASTDTATSIHPFLSDSETERAVASISDNQQPDFHREQENIFDGGIQVAEVVIDPQDENSSPSTDGVGIMFSLDKTMEERDSESHNSDGIPSDTLENDQVDICPTSGNVIQTSQGIQSIQASQSYPVAESVHEKQRESPPELSLKPVAEQIFQEQICPAGEENSTEEKGKESQPVESDGHTQRPPSRYQAENVRERSEMFVPIQTMQTAEIQVKDISHTSQIPQGPVLTSDILSRHANQELLPRGNILNNNQSVSSSHTDRCQEITVYRDASSVRINSTEVNPTSQLQTSAPLNRNQSRSSDEVNGTGRLTNNPPFLPSASLEMDTAISLALMSEMASSAGVKEPRTNQVTDKDKAPSSSASSVRYNKSVDTRTRHLSAPRVSGSIHREETPDVATPQRPNSVHGASNHGIGRSTEIPPGNQKTSSMTAKGRKDVGYGAGFTIVDSSGPIPLAPDNGLFDELKRRLMQDRGVNLNPGQPANILQPTACQNLPDSAIAYQSKNRPYEGWSGIPVEFPDGKRFIAYNREAFHILPLNQLGKGAIGLIGTPDQFPTVSSNNPSQFGGAVQIISSQVPHTIPQNIQLQMPNTVPNPSQVPHTITQNIQLQMPNTVPNPNSYQLQMGSNIMHSNPSFPVAQQIVQTFRPPPSTPSAESGLRNDYQQQLPPVDVHKSLSFFSSKAQQMSTDHVQCPPDQISINRMSHDFGRYQSSVSFQEACEGRTAPPRQSVPIPVQGVAQAAIAVTSERGERYTTEEQSIGSEHPTLPTSMTSSTQPRNRPDTATQVRRDSRESFRTNQQVHGASMHASECTKDCVEAQQRLFGKARGSVAAAKPQKGGNSGHGVSGINSTVFEQNGSRCQENIPVEHPRSQATGTPTNTSQSVGPGASASSVHHLPRDGNVSDRNIGICAPVTTESVDSGGLPGRPMSASSYMCDLAEISRRHTMNQNMHGNQKLPLQLQRDKVPAEGHEQVTNRSMANATNHASQEHPSGAINTGANQRPDNQDQVAQAENNDRALVTTIPDLYWQESAFLKFLPIDLANYLIKQREQGIPIAEAAQALLAERGETTARQQKRVWRSTIHYKSSDASPHSGVSSSSVSEASTHPTPLPYNNHQRANKAHPSVSRDILQQYSHNTSVDNSINPEAQQQLTKKSQGLQIIPGMTRNFYNPPPSVTPLLEADVVAESKSVEAGSIQAQTDILNSPEDSDSALDLRTRTLGGDVVVFDEDHPLISQFSLSNTNLYHRAYTAGEPGPIRASSLINLSSAAMVGAPIMEKSLSPTQLLIRNKLLERRLRIQSRSISTPDILQGYSYPPTSGTTVGESSIQPRNVSSPQNTSSPPYHVSDNQSREVGRTPNVASSHTDVQCVGSVNRAIQREIQGEVVAQNLTIADNREPVSQLSTSAHYPKMKASLQNRWVTETVHPTPVPGSDRQENAPAVDQNAHQVQTAQDNVHTSAPTLSATAIAVDQPAHSIVGSSSDHAAMQPSTLPVEVAPSASTQVAYVNLNMTGLTRTSQPPRKRKAAEVSPDRATCPFCSFEAVNSWGLRTHVNRIHFEKYSKPARGNAKPKRGGAKVASRVPRGKTATQRSPKISASNVQTNLNGQPITAPIQSVPQTDGSVPRTSGYNDVQGRTPQIVSGLTTTASINTTPASSSASLQPMPTPAYVPYTDHRQTDTLHTTEATSLVTHAVTNSSHTVEPNTAQQADEQLHCRYCSLPFKTSQDLLIHLKFQHANTKGLYMCFNCGYSTKSNSTLMKHILKWHGRAKGDDKTFKCTQLKCKESFSTEDELQRHYSSHEAQRTYVCELCNAKYKHITGLRYHQSRHTINYPHKCQQCGLKFKSTGMLQRHEFQKKHFSS
ncbi:uncharacterized protein LOC119739390 [Patiria miniata]|uniref:C2H2-type domain-containing protein n=1 Tax=Patiria miniata TaxID=46514 RepID=A0A914B2W5_PATMI|nr:uncharacterized protein LOC119739390 [Patiria miniata]XP_038070253.1 uncharacterized protein LOC119739390 [Patiria miniata]